MKAFARFWWLPGIAALICMLFNPSTGWYGLVMAVVLGAAYYTYRKLKTRKELYQKNRPLLKKMNKKQRTAYAKIDGQQEKNLRSLAFVMVPVLSIGDALLTVYTAAYNMANHRSAALFAWDASSAICWTMAAISALLLAASAGLFYLQAKELLDLEN